MKRGKKRDIAAEISNLIISKIESGTLPWRRPWTLTGSDAGEGGRPLRANGVPYTGINAVYLWAVGDALGYRSRYWMTYKQAKDLGAQVRRGEKSSLSVFFNSTQKTVVDKITGDEATKSIRFMRSYAIFNADQIDDLPERFRPDALMLEKPSPSERQAAIDAFFDPIAIEVRHGGDRAFYSPGGDYVQMPPKAAFRSSDHHAATLAHELGHATGATHRLGRTFGKRFGDRAYAFEELIADCTSGIICAELGLPCELHDSHASYIEGWLKILKADKTAIITAAAQAEKAYKWLAAFSQHDEDTEETVDDARIQAYG